MLISSSCLLNNVQLNLLKKLLLLKMDRKVVQDDTRYFPSTFKNGDVKI